MKNLSIFILLLFLVSCNEGIDIPTQVIQTPRTDTTQVLIAQTPIAKTPESTQTHSVTPSPFLFSFPEFPLDALIQSLPETCPAVGSQAYREPPLETVIPFQWDQFPIVLERGSVIFVTSTSDESNGDTTSLETLAANPGPDGISLREALEVSNHDPGEYTIQFDPILKGKIIQVGSWISTELPPLEGGSLILNGDIDGDQQPDITLENQIGQPSENNAIFGLRIHSSHNIVHALKITGFTVAVFFDAPATHQVYMDNTISYLFIEGESGIVLYSGQGSDDVPIPNTHNRWEHTRVVGNTIIVHNGSGISFSMHRAAMDSVAYLTIVDNHIQVVNEFEKGGGNGIDLSPGFGVGSDGNLVEHVIIKNNIIEGNPKGGAIALGSGFMSGEDNTIRDVYILGNTIRETYTYAEYMHTFGISITAGFWVTQKGNDISDIVVAGNSLEGNPEISVLISSGAVGSSKNRVERIYIQNNHIQITQPDREDGIPVGAVAITTGDGATDYNDPNFQPVVYPNDNILRDVWFSNNLVEGQGGSGVMLSTGDPGVERNRVERIYIMGNEFRQYFPDMGVLVTAISVEHGGSGDNVISDLFIQQNTIDYTNLRETFMGEEFVSGGMVLSAGNGASRNVTEDVWIVANQIASPAPGINLVAGWTQPQFQFPPSIGNSIQDVRIWCNTVVENPVLLESMFPGIKGINLAGGWGLAMDNRVEKIYIARNLIAGVEDDFSIFNNAGEGAKSNSVHFP